MSRDNYDHQGVVNKCPVSGLCLKYEPTFPWSIVSFKKKSSWLFNWLLTAKYYILITISSCNIRVVLWFTRLALYLAVETIASRPVTTAL